MSGISRREFLKITTSQAAAVTIGGCAVFNKKQSSAVPSYLKGYEKLYAQDPLKAALQWFKDAKFGLFMHYGVYSQLGEGEWVQYKKKIAVAEYENLKNRFTAENFDADFITDLALEAEMKYVNITTMHHDGFCLFRTKQTDFNSLNSPAKRDLVGELAEACRKKELGLCLYYSHGRHWRHPHAPNNDVWGGNARPEYEKPEPAYAVGAEHDLQKYVDYINAQVTELLTQYGPIANIWFDGWAVPKKGPTEKFKIPQTYELVRRLQPQTLISYKWGITGTEDFLAPEFHWKEKKTGPTNKPIEICTHIAGWGYWKQNDGKHRGPDSIMENLADAEKYNANLLLNTAPLPDGSIDKQDMETLREIGRRLRKTGGNKS